MSSTIVIDLQQMVDLTLGTVNNSMFNTGMLHALLHVIVSKLNMKNTLIELHDQNTELINNLIMDDPLVILDEYDLINSNRKYIPKESKTFEPNRLISVRKNKFSSDDDIIGSNASTLEFHTSLVDQQPSTDQLSVSNEAITQLRVSLEDFNQKFEIKLNDYLVESKETIRKLEISLQALESRMNDLTGSLRKGLDGLENRTDDGFRKIKTFHSNTVLEIEKSDNCVTKILSLETEFIKTMTEVQDMMDAKFDKYQVPMLKRYLWSKLTKIQDKLDTIGNSVFDDAAGTAMRLSRNCLSCGISKNQRYQELNNGLPKLPQLQRSIGQGQQQPLRYQPPQRDKGDRNLTSKTRRFCGGSHTVLTPNERVMKKGNFMVDYRSAFCVCENTTNNKGKPPKTAPGRI